MVADMITQSKRNILSSRGANMQPSPVNTFLRGIFCHCLSLLLQQPSHWAFRPNIPRRNPCPTRPCLRGLHTRQGRGQVRFLLDMYDMYSDGVDSLPGVTVRVKYILCQSVVLPSPSLLLTAGTQIVTPNDECHYCCGVKCSFCITS